MTTRRDAVRALAGIAALPLFERFGVYDLADLGRRAHDIASTGAPPRSLSPAEFGIVRDAAERIIPRTDTPGATDARVAEFIDVMLTDWYDPSETARFKAGLAELDARARSLSAGGFAKSSAKQQTELVETLDNEYQIERKSNTEAANGNWFAMLKHLTVWGYYTSELGITQELRQKVIPGYYDGNAQYRA